MSGSHSQIADCVALCRWTQSQSVHWKQASSLRNVPWYQRNVWSESGHVSLFGKKTYDRRSPATSQQRARQRWFLDANTLLTDRGALRRRLRANHMSNEATTSGMSLPQHGTVEPRTPPNYAASLLKFLKWVEHRERGEENDAEIDAATSTWMKGEFKKGSPESSERAVGQCLG